MWVSKCEHPALQPLHDYESLFLPLQVFDELSGDFMVDVIEVVDGLLKSGDPSFKPLTCLAQPGSFPADPLHLQQFQASIQGDSLRVQGCPSRCTMGNWTLSAARWARMLGWTS